jgi:hypothetical protein
LGDEHLLFVAHCAFIIPFWHLVVELIVVDDTHGMFGSRLGINHSLDE